MAKKTLLSIVGARPNFVKVGPAVDGLMRGLPATAHVIVHAGQHFDPGLSEILVDRLGFPSRTYWHEVGSGRLADVLGLRL